MDQVNNCPFVYLIIASDIERLEETLEIEDCSEEDSAMEPMRGDNNCENPTDSNSSLMSALDDDDDDNDDDIHVEWTISLKLLKPTRTPLLLEMPDDWPLGIRVWIDPFSRDDHRQLHAQFTHLDRDGNRNFDCPPSLTFTIPNPKNDGTMAKDYVLPAHLPFGKLIENHSYTVTIKRNIIARCARDGQLPLTIAIVEPKALSKNGYVKWTMDKYTLNRALSKNQFLKYVEGPHFYTSAVGYRVKVQLELEDTVSAIISFIAGEYDESRSKSFWHYTTVVIFNQWNSTSSSHVHKTMLANLSDRCSYRMPLVTHKELKKNNLIIDDALHLTISINPV